MRRSGRTSVSLYFGELKVGALLRRVKTDRYEICLRLLDDIPIGIELHPLSPPAVPRSIFGQVFSRPEARADQAREMRPETTSEHLARDMREGRFPEQSERQMVPASAPPSPQERTMTDAASKRIWADQENLTWVEECPGEAMMDYEAEYILASEHAALIQEAEARGMERAVSIMKDAGDSAVTEAMGQRLCCSGQDCGCHGATVEQYLEHIIRSEAAAIRARKETPLTEYERKVAQMKEDFPNGI